jgi:hypothetical protein
MNFSFKKVILPVVIMVVLALFLALIGYYWINRPKTENPEIPYKPTTMFSDSFSPFDLTVAQGATYQLTITLTTPCDTEISVPFENLSLTIYNNAVWHSSTPQERIFNYTFSPNSLTLQPYGTNSSILTVNMAEDAPIGRYVMYVTYGNSQLTHVGGNIFWVTVANP